MNVVYIFCKKDFARAGASLIRIPFFGYNAPLFSLLASMEGSAWNRERREFCFNADLRAESFSRIAFFLPYAWVDDSSPAPQYFFGSREIPGYEKAVLLIDEPPSSGAESGGNGHHLHRDGRLSQAAFSMGGSLRPLEFFPEHWQQKLEIELRSRKYSPQTRRSYIYYNRLLCRTLQKTPEAIQPDDVTEFLASVEKDRNYASSSLNLAISAVKFFYREVLKDDRFNEHHRPRNDGRLPQVLSKDEMCRIFDREKNPKHRLLLMMVYSSGLRVSEVVNLKKEHIDFSRKAIYIRQGKGRKDRCTILSEKVAHFITEYCSFYDIQKWLFPGQNPSLHLSIRSAQYIFDKAARNAQISKKISIHGLRHTFATHLLESGTDIRYIQSLLGHSCLRTTERYTHIARRNILSIKSPLDELL